MAAFEAIGGVPKEILYDRIKTAVIGEGGGSIVYNRALIDFARHYGFQPKACRPYRAKTKGKVERQYQYIREDFFLARSFRNLDDLNAQLRHWLDTVANPRVHATTQCVVNEAFAAEQPQLGALPLASFRSVLKLERRVSHEGMVSVGGNFYSVPDATRKRIVEVHTLANEVATAFVSMPTSCRRMFALKRSSTPKSRHSRRDAAVDRQNQNMELPITLPADHPLRLGNFTSAHLGTFESALTHRSWSGSVPAQT